jgi:hypothetical protein
MGVDNSTLDRVVDELQRIEGKSAWAKTLAIGALILDSFFQGDAELWRKKGGSRSQSLRRLAGRPECPLSKSALASAVAILLLTRDEPVLQFSNTLTPSHVAEVLSLTPADRQLLLHEAESEGLSVRALRDRVRGVRRALGERRGRPKHPTATRAINHLKNSDTAVFEAIELIRTSPPSSLSDNPELIRSMLRLEGRLIELRRLLLTTDRWMAVAPTPGRSPLATSSARAARSSG